MKDELKSNAMLTPLVLALVLENLTLVGSGSIAGAGNNADSILIGMDGNNTLVQAANDEAWWEVA